MSVTIGNGNNIAAMSVELFIARRLYKAPKGKGHISRPAVTIAQWGVAIGLVVMTISVAIIVGFKQEIRNRIAGFGGHIQIVTGQAFQGEEQGVRATNEEIELLKNCPGVAAVQQYIQKPGLLAANDEFEGIMLKGIGEGYDNRFFASHITEGGFPSPTDSIKEPWIVLSKNIAKRLNCKADEKINIYFMQGGIKARRMRVKGIFDTHMSEMDDILALCDIETLRKLNGWEPGEASGIEITADYEKLEDTRAVVTDIARSIARHTPAKLYVQTIEEAQPAMFAWLAALDNTVWIILVLVLGIAVFTIISGLLILILEKSNLIGILKAIGAQNYSVRKVFIYYACFIIVKGMLYGNIIAFTLCLLQKATGIAALDPTMYYMEKVPIEFTWLLLPMNIAIFVVAVAMLVLPSMLISKIEPVKVIKFE